MATDLEKQVKKSLEKVHVEFSEQALKNAELNDIEKRQLKPILDSKPIRIRMELTNECNLRCIFCYKSYFNVKKEHLEMDEFTKLDSFLKDAKFLTFFTKSEPLMAKNLFPRLNIAKIMTRLVIFQRMRFL